MSIRDFRHELARGKSGFGGAFPIIGEGGSLEFPPITEVLVDEACSYENNIAPFDDSLSRSEAMSYTN